MTPGYFWWKGVRYKANIEDVAKYHYVVVGDEVLLLSEQQEIWPIVWNKVEYVGPAPTRMPTATAERAD